MIGLGLSVTQIAVRQMLRGAFTPLFFFSNNEQGIWLDPSDFSTMFQDAAGTVPVTGVEQPVGRILDKSGRGNHATQATATSRPILRQDASGRYYLFFDGIDDSLVTGTITPGTDKVQVFAGVRKLSDLTSEPNGQHIVESSVDAGNNAGSLVLTGSIGFSSGIKYGFQSRGAGSIVSATTTGSSFAAPATNVLTGLGDISGDSAILRVNGTQVAQNTADQGTGNYLAYPFFIGRRGNGTLAANINLYQLTARFGTNLTGDQITQAETFFNSKTGAF